ncbi:alpha/beta hydrolase [Sphingomonas sp. URHD0057]|uniref:alpha/beta hydrolase n=1 Tax=Sphingomonas sp. URHD0057 TaxID=1380389 RepID=UPI000684DF99|nr:PHB depolymerase family esterase [Sphingomonas sp. URHD0057]
MRRAAGLAALLAAASPAVAAAPQLSSRPAATAATLAPGETTLANGAVAYRPASLPPGPAPVLILLHGAGGYPLDFLEQMKPVADQRGLMLLFPHSRGRTWDFIQNLAAERDPWRGGLDAHRIDQSLGDLFARASVDRKRVVLLGFSDGASYGLSLGTANPQLFSAVVGLSPGMFVPPDRVDREQRIFIAHGRSDHVLAFQNTSETIVRQLRGGGANLVFRPFAGDHQIEGKVLLEALDFTLGLQAPPLAPTSPPK